MVMFNFFETRSQTFPDVPVSSSQTWDDFGFFASTITGDMVTEDTALGVTSIWQAVNAIAGTLASLPCQLFKEDAKGGATKDKANPLYHLISSRPNENDTASAFYKWLVSRILLEGRGTAYIQRNKAGRVAGLIPLDSTKLQVKQGVVGNSVVRTYHYSVDGKTRIYASSDVIDVVMLTKADGVTHRNPIHSNRDAIALMIAAQKFSGRLFANGGVPALALHSPVGMAAPSPVGEERAINDVNAKIRAAASTKANVLMVPPGHELKPLAIDPAKSQVVELRRFLVSETSRIFNVAPAILHDLTNGTYANTEQQALSFSQRTLAPLVEMIEQEMNAKLFGARNSSNYIKFNMSAMQRGDFASRMTGYAQAVQNAIYTPNECRAMEELGALPNGDDLLIQGATVPLGSQPVTEEEPKPDDEPKPEDDTSEDDQPEDGGE